MYVKEMHIEVDLALQKIGANRTRKLLPQEVDWLLNSNQERFIRSRMRPKLAPQGGKTGGFEILQDDVDAIKALVRNGVTLPAFRLDDRKTHSPLPGDYSYLLQDESVIKRIPPGITPTITYGQRYLNVFPINPSTRSTAPYYSQVQVVLNGNLVIDLANYVSVRQQQWTGFSAADEVWEIINPMLRQAIDDGYEAYWEYYENYTRPRSLIIITPAPATGQVTIDGVTTASISSTAPVQFMDAPYSAQYQSNRLTPSNLVSSLLGGRLLRYTT
jgi:hypothetical protein